MQLFDYTAVVFGQDADHELTEAEKEAQEKQAAIQRTKTLQQNGGKRKKVIFHKKNKKGQVETVVKSLDPNDTQQEMDIRNEDAVVVEDVSPSTSAEDAMEKGVFHHSPSSTNEKVIGDGANGRPTKTADAQDVGGLIKQGEM